MPTKSQPKLPSPMVIHMVCTDDLSNDVGEFRAYDPSTTEAKDHICKPWERVLPVAAIPFRTLKQARAFAKFWAMSESERVSAITAIIEEDRKPGPFCRDCADNDGVCPGTGKACDPHERLARAVLAAIEGARK